MTIRSVLWGSVVAAAAAVLAGCPGTGPGAGTGGSGGTTSGEGSTSSTASTTGATGVSATSSSGTAVACTSDADCTNDPCDICPEAVELCLAPLAPVASLAPGVCKRALPTVHFSSP